MFRKLFLHSPVRYIVGVVLALIIGFLCLLSKGFEYRISYVDAFSVAGGAVFFLGLLQMVSHYGAFDIFGYSFSSFRRKEREYTDYIDYQTKKRAVKSNSKLTYMPFIAVGAIFFIIGMILNVCLL
ncbi:MAG: DUF3899 domain-containing protein [Lachnospiraceae bacterium]|nr:DUF3899 domain-containing protein [Lachnospiraceae bacterium]